MSETNRIAIPEGKLPSNLEMAGEISQHLMDKFSTGLGGKGKNSSLVLPYGKFIALNDLITRKLEQSQSPDEVRSLTKKLHYLNNLLTECQMISSKKGLYTPHELLSIFNIKNSLKKIKLDIVGERKSNRSSNQHQNGESSLPKENKTKTKHIFRRSSCQVDVSRVHGFDDEVISLERLLLQRETGSRFNAIGIFGMSGIGKTTLTQVMFNKQEIKERFLPRIWICVSKQPTDKESMEIEIVRRMLMKLGVDDETIQAAFSEHNLGGLLFLLNLQLRGKRYLIVIDDASETGDWYGDLDSELNQVDCYGADKWKDKLAYGLPKGNGGTVIVTSRTEEVAKKMVGQKNLFPLFPLSDSESCWLIFKDEVTKDGKKFMFEQHHEFKAEIIKKSEGLPLAAKTMGQIMYEQQDRADQNQNNGASTAGNGFEQAAQIQSNGISTANGF